MRPSCAAFSNSCRPACSACSTRPTPSTRSPSPRGPGCCETARHACACCARSRRCTASPRCGSATRWPRRTSPTRSIECARSSTSTSRRRRRRSPRSTSSRPWRSGCSTRAARATSSNGRWRPRGSSRNRRRRTSSMPTCPGATPAPAGPAHVAVVSFLAARAAPTGGFWIALAGGVALARLAERRGALLGFGASAAAMLETVAIIGPARLGIPLTQAATAPLLGRLEARGWRPLPQILACAAIRLLHNAATTAFFIWVVTGGLDAYAGTYDAISRRLGIEVGTADALALTLLGLVAWAAFACTVQVLVYRRGLRAWTDPTPEGLHPDDTRRSWLGIGAFSATDPPHP